MVSLRPRLVGATALIAILLVAVAGGAQEEDEGYRDHYRVGRDAFDAGRWEEAVSALRQALEERENERARILGMPLGRYLPRYYLGIALAELGRCSDALEVFAAAEADGAIGKADELHAELEAKRLACLERLRLLRRSLQQGRSLVEEARSGVKSAAERMENPVLGTPDFAERLERAREETESAARGLRAAASAEDRSAAERATAQARRAQTALDELLADLAAREAAAHEFTEEKLERVVELARQGRILVGRSRELERLPAALTRRVEALEALLEQAVAVEEVGAGSLEELERSLGRQVADLRAALRPPPEVLEAAARAFLVADHETVIELLEEVGRGPGRVAAHACLLRSASWLTLAARDGREDLRARAAQEIDACPDFERHVDLSPALFSPAVVAFIESAIRARPGPPPPRTDEARQR